MAKVYFFKFGSGDPRTYTGISPTMIIMVDQSGTDLTAPAITEAKTGSGIFKFTYTPTVGIAFLIDGFTTLLAASDRYVTNALDPIQTIDAAINDTTFGVSAISRTVTLMVGGISNLIAGYSTQISGYSNMISGYSTQIAGYSVLISGFSAIGGAGTSFILSVLGSTASSYGTTVDPVDIFGYLKRLQEFNEGNQTYLKSSNQWSIYTRGSSALLALKTLADAQTTTTKT